MSDGEQSIMASKGYSQPQVTTRQALLKELESLGLDLELFDAFTVDQLANLLYALNRAANPSGNSKGSRPGKSAKNSPASGLSAVDKKLLKMLLESQGDTSSLQLSRELEIPLSTVQRRRKRLEGRFIVHSYSLKYDAFAKRQITFIVSLGGGIRSEVVKEVLALDRVVAVTRTFGDGLDLKVEAVLETNEELAGLSEQLKSISGVQKVSWFESIEVLERNREVDISIIDSL